MFSDTSSIGISHNAPSTEVKIPTLAQTATRRIDVRGGGFQVVVMVQRIIH